MSVTRVRALMHRNHLWRAAASLVVSVCVVTLSLGGPASPFLATAFLLSGALLIHTERCCRTSAPVAAFWPHALDSRRCYDLLNSSGGA
jgi:hypothetical protein